jgi:catechol 2,3-dioxygenase-like lactoylglutathione lyase family enzyme
MPIQNVIINSTDVNRSVDFYTRYLDARLVGEATKDGALLDFVTAILEVRAVSPGPSSWLPDDLQLGFRHIGFKVDRVDPRAEVLKAAGVPFQLDPFDAEGGVRICFFFDADGTLLELVEGDLQYATVLDSEGVAAERALGVPERPRFDHVAVTVRDRAATEAFFSPLTFSFIGTIEQPQDPRGFRIGYLKSGDTVLEIFTYDAEKRPREPQLDAPGFSHAVLTGIRAPAEAVPVAGTDVLLDPNGFPFAVRSGAAS